jgi:hypothetical protein
VAQFQAQSSGALVCRDREHFRTLMHTPPRQDVVESRQQSRIFIPTGRHEGAGSHDALPTRCLLISIALGAQFARSNCMDCRASRPSPYARAMPASAKRAYGRGDSGGQCERGE